MTSGKPWKLYAAPEGQPRQLIGAFDTLKEAASEFRDIEGGRSGKLAFTVRVNLDGAPTARFENSTKASPYIIELFE